MNMEKEKSGLPDTTQTSPLRDDESPSAILAQSSEKCKQYDTDEAVKAQAEYCRSNGIPNFAPAFDGKCYSCDRNIYQPITHRDGRITGITVQKAGSELIIGCPHCNFSFVD